MATINNWVRLSGRSYIDATIAAEATESDVIALGNRVICALQFDDDFAGVAVTLQCGGADDDLAAYYYDTGAVSVTVDNSRFVGIDLAKTFPITGYVKLISGTQQGAATPSVVRVFALDEKSNY